MLESFLSYLPQYCERSGPGLAGEPVNTATNLAFFLAAWALARARPPDAAARLLLFLLILIGAGSLLWHLTAWPWTLWADVGPIATFMLVYLWVFLRRVAGLGRVAAMFLFALFLAGEAAVAVALPPQRLNGVGFYLPGVAALAAMSGWLALRGKRRAAAFAVAAGLMALAIGARLLDWPLCGWLPVGTHFLWHLGAAAALYVLLRATFSTMPAARQRDPFP